MVLFYFFKCLLLQNNNKQRHKLIIDDDNTTTTNQAHSIGNDNNHVDGQQDMIIEVCSVCVFKTLQRMYIIYSHYLDESVNIFLIF
jgi:hypothetical protein